MKKYWKNAKKNWESQGNSSVQKSGNHDRCDDTLDRYIHTPFRCAHWYVPPAHTFHETAYHNVHTEWCLMCLSAEVWEEYSLLHFLNLQRNLYSCPYVTWIFKAWVLANFLPHNEHFLVVHQRRLHRMYFFSFTTRVFLFL